MIAENWQRDVQRVPIGEIAEALQIESKGRGAGRTYKLEHEGCDSVHSSGGFTVYIGKRAGRLLCRRCHTTGSDAGRFDGVDLIAISLGLGHRRERAPEEWAKIREAAAGHGWCTPDPGVRPAFDVEVWRREREERMRRLAAAEREREKARRSGAVDVAAAWRVFEAGRVGWLEACEWMVRVRGLPHGLARHLPVADLAAVPAAWPDINPPPGFTPDELDSAARLLNHAAATDRRVLVALRDVEGRRLSLKTRWHKATPPAPGQLKSVNLPGDAGIEGPPSTWARETAVFGDVPIAAAKARNGEPVVLVEGEVDWLIASAALRYAGVGYALGAPGVHVMHKVAEALAAELRLGRLRPIRRPVFPIFPDRDKAKPGEPNRRTAARAAWRCQEILASVGDAIIRHTGADDLNDFTREQRLDANGVAGYLLGRAA